MKSKADGAGPLPGTKSALRTVVVMSTPKSMPTRPVNIEMKKKNPEPLAIFDENPCKTTAKPPAKQPYENNSQNPSKKKAWSKRTRRIAAHQVIAGFGLLSQQNEGLGAEVTCCNKSCWNHAKTVFNTLNCQPPSAIP